MASRAHTYLKGPSHQFRSASKLSDWTGLDELKGSRMVEEILSLTFVFIFKFWFSQQYCKTGSVLHAVSKDSLLNYSAGCNILKGSFHWIFLVLYSTLWFYLPPLRFHWVGGCWDRTQDSCDYYLSDALTVRSRNPWIACNVDHVCNTTPRGLNFFNHPQGLSNCTDNTATNGND
jgi:hypothetical protein